MKKGKLHTTGEWKTEHYKQIMINAGLYALAMSEIRRDGSGEEDIGDGFVLAWQGNEDCGSRGGVGILLSPAAAKAWRAAKKPGELHGSKARSTPSGRILAISLKLGGDEGTWNLISVYGPTAQCSDSEKDQFFSQLQEIYDKYPTDEVTIILGERQRWKKT